MNGRSTAGSVNHITGNHILLQARKLWLYRKRRRNFNQRRNEWERCSWRNGNYV